jgi:hypothetical protein
MTSNAKAEIRSNVATLHPTAPEEQGIVIKIIQDY